MSQNPRARKVRENTANPLFTEWLKEWRDEAASKNSHSKLIYARALQSLNKFPLPLKSGKECNILKNFGQKICDLLDKKLEEYRRLHPEFEENATVSVPLPREKSANRPQKKRVPASSSEQQPGPSGVRAGVVSKGPNPQVAKPSSKFQGVPNMAKARLKPALKSSAMASLRIQKVNTKAPRVKIGSRKSSGKNSSQQAPVAVIEPQPRSPSPPAPASPPRALMPRFSLDSPVSPIGKAREPAPEVIDLSQQDDPPEPDVDSLLLLTNDLLAAASAGTGMPNITADNEKDHCDINQEEEDDSDNFVGRSRPPTESTTPTVSPARGVLSLERRSDDSLMDRIGEQKVRDQAIEDSFDDLLPRPNKALIEEDDSILDITAGIRKKRESFLKKLASQAPPKQAILSEAPDSSFLNSPSSSVAVTVPDYPHCQENHCGAELPDELREAQKTSTRENAPLVISEDSDDELLVPLSERLKLNKAPAETPTRKDSFALLVENLETPPVCRVMKSTENDAVIEPDIERPRKRSKETEANLDGDAAPKKKPRKQKNKGPTAEEVPTRVFKLRYVPEGSRLPVSNHISHPASKCPHRISMPSGTFDIVLCVDSCEATGGVATKKKEAMIQALQDSGVKMEVRKMNVGDFAWIAKSGDHELVLDCVVERKRSDDLASSIKDGRYAEQKHRLLTSGIKRKIYLIEEYNRFATGGITDQALLQAQMNTQVINDFIVKITKNTKESARYLTTLTRALEVKYRNLHLRSCLKEEAQMYENHLMTWQEYNEAGYKRKKICTREMFIRALMVIRAMSLERALTIVAVYPTVTALVQAFDRCDDTKQKDKLLADLKCPISGRRIGPALSKALKQIFVHCPSEE
ncbi:nucleolar and coiled-body phosphoprotein 1 [Galendromus occidentalis]|uniref:Crossover junction endonuclease MUS81 n=1 Tax=Galendromus occidentalis TaxID=34638 RepID=A0AAJ7SGM0_9ACAR|nr:nucleolar and coiled-body phosphoprotein 1 [Galendromus occidentalis]